MTTSLFHLSHAFKFTVFCSLQYKSRELFAPQISCGDAGFPADSGMNHSTHVYKKAEGRDICLDIWIPNTSPRSRLGAIVYFHGGGLTVGDRTSWFPTWMLKRATSLDLAFISADYSLISPLTGHDILEDIKDLFRFLSTDINKHIPTSPGLSRREIDPNSLVVAGTSAGGLCAYLAALHAQPKPKALFSMYGMGGNFMTPQYLSVKTEPFFRGRELLDPANFSQFLYPFSPQLIPTSGSSLAYHPATSPTPGYPANPRMQLTRLFLQLGIFLDYYTGDHDPSLSYSLQTALHITNSLDADKFRSIIPARHLRLFPQFNISASFPPTFLIHGEVDTAVPTQESWNMYKLLKDAGVTAEIRIVEGKEHSFDYEPGSEESHSKLFDEVFEFVMNVMQTSNT